MLTEAMTTTTSSAEKTDLHPTSTTRNYVTIDGNEAAAHVAYRVSEVIAIYPITPATPMGELSDAWSAGKTCNIWGSVPKVVEMQSEAGAAATVHGALQTGSLSTTFTASQGLLLMIPNMYKIAGELTSTVFHISARSLAAQGLSIFGDHSDVMAARSTGWGMLFANSVQEVMDCALISHAASLESRVPFLHVFDGFRTSHEIQKIEPLTDEQIGEMIDMDLVHAHRKRGLNPEDPFIRGTAQNPDTYFQGREAANPYYLATPEIVQKTMDRFAELTGRRYSLVEYVGAEDADRVIVCMGSGCETIEETVEELLKRGSKVGLLKVRLYRPFPREAFIEALPASVKSIAVLDRTKEPGAPGEPLYQDVMTTMAEAFAAGKTNGRFPRIVGGRYGLSSKEFTPAMVAGIYNLLKEENPKNSFTVGIIDDVTHTSIDVPTDFLLPREGIHRAVFWGLGSDGTVGANKNSIKIIGEGTENFAQGYFVYDSKKAGARTVSHLRFGEKPVRSPYLIDRATFVGVHQFGFLSVYDCLETATPGCTFLLNSPYGADEVWDQLPRKVQETIIEKNLKFYVIDAYSVARETGMGNRINTVMQTCFFAISGVMPQEEAIAKIKEAIVKTYGKRGETVVNMNFAAVDAALAHLHEVKVPGQVTSDKEFGTMIKGDAPEFVKEVTTPMMSGLGDGLPVSKVPADGTWPSATTQYEKRNIAQEIPVWEPDICIQCGKCVMVCPHSVIRGKVYEEGELSNAPEGFKFINGKWREMPDKMFTIQVAPEDCTGCTLCVDVCPAKDKTQVGRKAINMAPLRPIRDREIECWDFFQDLPDIHPTAEPSDDTYMPDPVMKDGEPDPKKQLSFDTVKNTMLLQPTFEFSSACAGCGETPYLRLISQLFGDRMFVANATGCSSIYGGNLPTTPWAKDKTGRGPAWSNSLFEDNAEFGLGMRMTIDKQVDYACNLVNRLSGTIGEDLARAVLEADQSTEEGIREQRQRVNRLVEKLEGNEDAASRDLLSLADKLVRKAVWIVGGDGWAYDIGFGGLDHVLASGHNINILVLDTEVYSNTGGQASKSTSLGAVAKFAAGGKATAKKDLGLLAMSYGHVYVAQIAMGASDNQTVKALREAESFEGPSLVIAYSHCIAHGIDMTKGFQQQELANKSGHWPLYRFDPRRALEDQNPMQLDSKKPKIPLKDYIYNENRYRILQKINPEAAGKFLAMAQENVNTRWERLEEMSKKWE